MVLAKLIQKKRQELSTDQNDKNKPVSNVSEATCYRSLSLSNVFLSLGQWPAVFFPLFFSSPSNQGTSFPDLKTKPITATTAIRNIKKNTAIR